MFAILNNLVTNMEKIAEQAYWLGVKDATTFILIGVAMVYIIIHEIKSRQN